MLLVLMKDEILYLLLWVVGISIRSSMFYTRLLAFCLNHWCSILVCWCLHSVGRRKKIENRK